MRRTPTVIAATAALVLAGTAGAWAETFVVEQDGPYVAGPYVNYAAPTPIYGSSTIVVPAEPTIAVPAYSVAPRAVVVEPQPTYVAPRYVAPRPSHGLTSVQYADPWNCSWGYCD